MSSRGFIARAKAPAAFEDALVNDLDTATREQLVDLIFLQKTVLMATEDYMGKGLARGPVGDDSARRSAIFHLGRAIEATPQDLVPLQDRIGAWSRATFGQNRAAGTLNHLRREVEELVQAHVTGNRAGQGEEAADCLILLMNYAAERGFSLLAEAEGKFAVVQGRTWKDPDAEGVIEHDDEARHA